MMCSVISFLLGRVITGILQNTSGDNPGRDAVLSIDGTGRLAKD